jgi:hypothetical protein
MSDKICPITLIELMRDPSSGQRRPHVREKGDRGLVRAIERGGQYRYSWTGHKSSSGFSGLTPSILQHYNWFWDNIC